MMPSRFATTTTTTTTTTHVYAAGWKTLRSMRMVSDDDEREED